MASAYANWFHFTDEVKVGACRCAGLCEIGTGLGKLTAWSWVELEISENVVSCRHSGSKPRRYIVIAFLSGFTRTSDEVVAPIILFYLFVRKYVSLSCCVVRWATHRVARILVSFVLVFRKVKAA